MPIIIPNNEIHEEKHRVYIAGLRCDGIFIEWPWVITIKNALADVVMTRVNINSDYNIF